MNNETDHISGVYKQKGELLKTYIMKKTKKEQESTPEIAIIKKVAQKKVKWYLWKLQRKIQIKDQNKYKELSNEKKIKNTEEIDTRICLKEINKT